MTTTIVQLLIVFSSAAHANDTGPVAVGFLSPPRTDAPIDAWLLFEANFEPVATVLDGPGAPFTLKTEQIVPAPLGSGPAVAFLPPPGNWTAGATYTVQVSNPYKSQQGKDLQLSFTVGQDTAPAPASLSIGPLETEPWTDDDQTSGWGCCNPLRQVTLPVTLTSDDPWVSVEVIGHYDLGRPESFTVAPVALDVGAGERDVQFLQVFENDLPQPACVDVYPVSSAGERGTPERVCAEDGPGEEPPQDTADTTSASSCGCASGPSTPMPLLGLGLLGLYLRRHSRRRATVSVGLS